MGHGPILTVDGKDRKITRSDDVFDLFVETSEFSIGSQIGELVVDTIDAELDYDSSTNEYVLRCYVYFESILDEENAMAFIDEKDLSVSDEWEIDNQMVGENRLGVVYERRA